MAKATRKNKKSIADTGAVRSTADNDGLMEYFGISDEPEAESRRTEPRRAAARPKAPKLTNTRKTPAASPRRPRRRPAAATRASAVERGSNPVSDAAVRTGTDSCAAAMAMLTAPVRIRSPPTLPGTFCRSALFRCPRGLRRGELPMGATSNQKIRTPPPDASEARDNQY